MNRYCLIGYPLVHSMSPFIHRVLFSLSGKDGEYENLPIPPDELTGTHCVFKDYDGFNVTIPHKLSVLPFLSKLDESARFLGAVNTVKKDPLSGQLIGYNTDCEGFLQTLKATGIPLSGRVLIAGYGGTSRMMSFVSAKNGCDIVLAVRHKNESAEKLRDELRNIFPNRSVDLLFSEEIDGRFTWFFNGTPAGMYPSRMDLLPVDERLIGQCQAVFDAVYNPRNTRLLALARAEGIPAIGGMSMLVLQAAAAHRIWYSAEFSPDDLSRLIEETNAQMERKFCV